MKFIISSKYDLDMQVRTIKHGNRCIEKLKKNIKNKHMPQLRESIIFLEVTPIEISINERLGKWTWAWANVVFDKDDMITKGLLSISPKSFDHGRKFLYEVVSHEMSHLLEFSLRGDSDHGKLWKDIHRLMDGSGNRTIGV
jgi:hypothetical protein